MIEVFELKTIVGVQTFNYIYIKKYQVRKQNTSTWQSINKRNKDKTEKQKPVIHTIKQNKQDKTYENQALAQYTNKTKQKQQPATRKTKQTMHDTTQHNANRNPIQQQTR